MMALRSLTLLLLIAALTGPATAQARLDPRTTARAPKPATSGNAAENKPAEAAPPEAAPAVATQPSPSPAPASGSAAETSKLIEEARLMYGLADFEGALAKLDQALELSGDARLKARLQVYRAANLLDMKQRDKAQEAVLAALHHDPMVEAPDDLKAVLRQFLQALREQSRGILHVRTEVTCPVFVDGKEVGLTPYSGEMPIGSRLVAVRCKDRPHKEQTVVLFPGRHVTVSLRVGKAIAALPEPRGGRVFTWIVGAAAVASAGTGLGLWLSSDADYDEWTSLQDRAQHPVLDETRLTELEDSIRRKEIASYALWGVGGALAITSLVLFFVEEPDDDPPPAEAGATRAAALTVEPLLGPQAGVGLRLRF